MRNALQVMGQSHSNFGYRREAAGARFGEDRQSASLDAAGVKRPP
jgi:hypothetical protein